MLFTVHYLLLLSSFASETLLIRIITFQIEFFGLQRIHNHITSVHSAYRLEKNYFLLASLPERNAVRDKAPPCYAGSVGYGLDVSSLVLVLYWLPSLN